MTTPPWLKIIFKLEQRYSGVFRDLVTLGACVCRSGRREDEDRRTAAEFKPEEPSGLCEAFRAMMRLKRENPFLNLFSAASIERLSEHAPSSVAREGGGTAAGRRRERSTGTNSGPASGQSLFVNLAKLTYQNKRRARPVLRCGRGSVRRTTP